MRRAIYLWAALFAFRFALFADPVVLAHPQSTNVHVGGTVTFSVSATNSGWSPNFQWRFNGSNLAGQTASTLQIRFCEPTNAGTYSVAVTARINGEGLEATVISSNAVLTLVEPSYTTTNIVTSPDQSSLLSALTNGGVVLFACDGTIVFTNAITLSRDTVIDGTGHNIILDGGGSNRHFYVCLNVAASFRNLTFANGHVGEPIVETASGGAIFNDAGIVEIQSCVFSNNCCIGNRGPLIPHFFDGFWLGAGFPALGGAIYNKGVIKIQDSQFALNNVTGGHGALDWLYGLSEGRGGDAGGAAIYNDDGVISMDNSIIRGNTATAGGDVSARGSGAAIGGGVNLHQGTMTVSNCLFADNVAQAGRGGSAKATGGAMVSSGRLQIETSVFTNNHSIGLTGEESTYGGLAEGGGVVSSGILTVTACDFLNNGVLGGDGLVNGGPALAGAVLNFGTGEISGSHFNANYCVGGHGVNGGIASGGALVNYGNLVFTSNVVSSNFANSAASYGGFGSLQNANQCITANNTFSNNTITIRTSLLTNHFQVGQQATFTISNSIATNGYLWRFEDAPIDASDSSTLVRTNLQMSDVGLYAVTCPNDFTMASLAVSVAPVITTPLYIQNKPWVKPSIYNYISVGVTGTPLQYQWYFNGTSAPGATNDTYPYSPDNAHSGAYYVAISNAAGVVVSEPIELFFPPLILNPSPPTAVGSYANKNASAGEGSPVTLIAAVEGTEPLAYQWYCNGMQLPGAINSTFTISSVNQTNAGYYFVVVTNAYGSTTSSNVQLSVVLPPSIVSGSGPQLTVVGSNITYDVIVTNTDNISYQWRLNGTNIVGATNSSLIITNVQTNGAGVYSVVVNNGYAAITNAFDALTVLGSPSIQVPPASHFAAIGYPTTFSVTATGAPPLRYQWSFSGKPLVGQTNPVLTLPNVRSLQAGNYRVTVSNSFGSVQTSNAYLRTIWPVVLTSVPRSLVVNSNATVKFAVAATGSALTYQWQLSDIDIPGATNSYLLLTNVGGADEGTYKVIVSNPVSSTNTTASLGVVTSPFDLNQNGETDLLLRNRSTGKFSAWLMKGTNIVRGTSLGPDISPSLRIVGLNDFDGYGQKSIVLQASNGAVYVVSIAGTNLSVPYCIDAGTVYESQPGGGGGAAAAISTLQPGPQIDVNASGNVSAEWTIVGVADLNHDGSGDLIACNDSRQVAVWCLNGTNFLDATPLLLTPATNMPSGSKIVAIADFNGDGSQDILWQNSTGYLTAWLLDGTTYLQDLPLLGGKAIGTGWKVVAVADFNYDGWPDLILQNSLGYVMVKFLQDGISIRSALLHGGTPINPAVSIVAPR